MSNSHIQGQQFTDRNRNGSELTLVTIVNEEDLPSGRETTTATNSSSNLSTKSDSVIKEITPKQKREWSRNLYVKTICAIALVATLILISAISVPVLFFQLLGEVGT